MIKVFLLLLIILISSCSNKEENKLLIKEKDLELQMIDSYQKGVDALEIGDGITAAKNFNEAELLFPQSEWAPKSALMAAYSYYSVDNYYDAINEIELYIKKSLFSEFGLYSLDYKVAGDFDFLVRVFYKREIKWSYLNQITVKMRHGGISNSGLQSKRLINCEILS